MNTAWLMLTENVKHEEGCDLHTGMCDAECEWAYIHAELKKPLTWAHEQKAHARLTERREALMRGEVIA